MPDDRINPSELKTALSRQNMTQQQLADRLGCTKDTVSRWMRGKNRRVRSHLRPRLEEALKVSFETLARPSEEAYPGRHDGISPERAEMRFSLRLETRAALRLVALRYNLPAAVVMDFAPLLFLLAAERSLLTRKARLEELRAGIKELALRAASTKHSRLADLDWGHGDDGEFFLDEEEESIAARDVFGRNVSWATDSYMFVDPLVNFLEEEAKQLPDEAVTDIALGYEPLGIHYEIAEDTLRECTGLQEGNPALHYLLAGDTDLDECLRIKRTRDDEGYRQWLREELDRIAREPNPYREFKERQERIRRALDAKEMPRNSDLEDR